MTETEALKSAITAVGISPAPVLAEYGSELAEANPSVQTVLLQGLTGWGCPLRLIHCTPGYEPAGSAMRLVRHECWRVRWFDGRAWYGQAFVDAPHGLSQFQGGHAKAIEHYEKLRQPRA